MRKCVHIIRCASITPCSSEESVYCVEWRLGQQVSVCITMSIVSESSLLI